MKTSLHRMMRNLRWRFFWRDQARSGQDGSAALEVLLLIPFILLIWMLLFNMGYNGVRHRKAQGALRLGAFQYVNGLATMNSQQSAQNAEALVNDRFFPGEQKAASLFFSGQAGKPNGIEDDQGVLGRVSSRQTVSVSVKREPPYANMMPRQPLQGGLIVAANTWTFCEMKDEDFGRSLAPLRALALVGDYGLWLFGGCGGDNFQFNCDDRCPN